MITVLITAVPDIVFFFGNIAILVKVQKHRDDVNSGESQSSDDKSQGRVTRTAVVLSSLHLILTLPSVIYYIKPRQIDGTAVGLAAEIILGASLFNYGLNILVYTGTSQTFRKELYSLCRCIFYKD